MSEHVKSIFDGVAFGLAIIGTLGFAINSGLALALLAIDILAGTIYYMGRELSKLE